VPCRYLEQSIYWLQKAVDQGFLPAFSKLAIRYIAQQDFANALKYAQIAANEDDATAQGILATILYAGCGIEKDAEAARYWANKAGIGHYQSKVKPDDKQALVKKLQAEGKHVMMIGDGINDTQALALADVSMAIGKGTDVAMDVAQVTLMGDDLMTIPDAVKLSRKTVSMIWQNLFWAFIYNLICIPLAAGVLYLFGINFQITPMGASALMACSSVSVVLNSLRLRFA